MSINIVYIIACVLPLIMTPVVLPMVVLMARRKNMTDSPNERKLQDRPVVVMGGTVIMLVICVTLIVVNLFYDIGILFPIVCIMVIMFIFGMLDDSIGLSWQFKAVMEVVAVLLLFFGGSYGVHSLFGFFITDDLPMWLSFILTVFFGLVILNAVNFVDGIDGLASALGILGAAIMAVWNIRHYFIDQAIISFVMLGAMTAFFIYNVFSNKFKTFMGDSGSLVLGLFVYMSACPAAYNTVSDEMLADRYFVSFIFALFSAMLFDFVRVVLSRIINGKSPFHPDRRHLHHIFVDYGMSHLLTTVIIVLSDAIVILVWYLTAETGISIVLQFLIVVVTGVLLFWVPYFYLDYVRKHRPEKYQRKTERCIQFSEKLMPFMNVMNRIVDGRRRSKITHNIE